jgi:hypothetical protein
MNRAREQLLATATEDELQLYVEHLLGLHGWTWHHAGDSRRSTAGLPDIVAVRAPRVLFAELKTAKGRPRAEQRVWLDELGNCPGVECYLWRPRDLDEIAEVLK